MHSETEGQRITTEFRAVLIDPQQSPDEFGGAVRICGGQSAETHARSDELQRRTELDLEDKVKGNPWKSHCVCGPQVTGVSSKQVPRDKSLRSPENPADTLSG